MSVKKAKRIVALALTAVLYGTTLAGCGSAASTGSSKASGGDKLTLHLATSGDEGIQQPLVQIAEEEGYYKDYGLTLKRTKLGNNGSLMYDALAAGKVNTAYQQMVPPISYAAQGEDVKLFGGLISGGMVAVVRKDDYDELKDLKNWKNHKIGVVQMSTSELTTRWVLENEYKLDDNDLKYVMIEDYPSISLGVQKGSIDIGFISSQYVSSAEDQGLKVVKYLDEIKPNYVCCRQSANGTYLKEHRDAYVAYLKGQIKAYKILENDHDKVVDLLAKNTGEDKDYINKYVYDYEGSGHRVYNPDPNYNGCEEVYEELLKQKYVKSDRTLDQLYDISVYADALKQVIKENPDDDFYKGLVDTFLKDNSDYPDFKDTYNETFFGTGGDK